MILDKENKNIKKKKKNSKKRKAKIEETQITLQKKGKPIYRNNKRGKRKILQNRDVS